MSAYRYINAFRWESPYGHIVRMIEQLSLGAGLIVDIGCGSAPIAEPLIERGFDYLGVELDEEALAFVTGRGIEARRVDLTSYDTLAGELVEQVAGRHVAAFLLIDVLEHIPAPDVFLAVLRTAGCELGRPPLFVSVPNATHIDVAAKLLAARWDMTPTGLLDSTHVGFFGDRRLIEVLGRHGWSELIRDDFALDPSDQHFPAGLACLEAATNLGGFLRDVRNSADEFATVNQFVRGYTLLESVPGPPAPPVAPPFLSVVVRTAGHRRFSLDDALTCLAAQSDADFEVLVAVQDGEPHRVQEVQATVAGYDPIFAGRTRVLPVVGGGRTRAFNAAIDEVRGRYVAFLDEDDLVAADWVEQFRAGASRQPGAIVRSGCADQRHVANPSGTAPCEPSGPITVSRPLRFDPIGHYHENQTPMCSLALPTETLRGLHLRFDESLAALEDWDLLLRTATHAGVVDTEVVTSIRRVWDDGGDSPAACPAEAGEAAREAILDRLDARPVLLPPGTVRRLADPDRWRVPDQPPHIDDELAACQSQLVGVAAELDALRAQLDAIEGSEWWRATAPFRRAGTVVRRILRRA